MKHNQEIKNILDNIIADLSDSREQYVKNPGIDFTRDRKLPFEKVIKLVLSMKGNTLNKELYDFFGRNPEEIVTSSAFIQQRDKLNENLFVDLFHRFNDTMTDAKTFRGYRLFAVDGSDINIAYDETSDTYMKPQRTKKDGELSKGYNQYHLNAIYDLLNKVYIEAKITPRQIINERKDFIDMLNNMALDNKTLFIADRGYPSWNVFAHFKYKENADYLIRVKNGQSNLVKNLPMAEFDIDLSTTVTTKQSRFGQDGYTVIYIKKNKVIEFTKAYI